MSYIRYFFLQSSYIFTSCTTRSTCLYCRIIVQVIGPPSARTSLPINWSDRLVHGLRHRPVDRIVCWSPLLNAHFATDQLTRLFVAHASSLATPVTPRCTDTSCSRTKWAHFTAQTSLATPVLEHRQLRRGLLGARTSPAMPGTPRCSNIASYVGNSLLLGHRQLRGSYTEDSSVLGHR